jgi:hypothetical protein
MSGRVPSLPLGIAEKAKKSRAGLPGSFSVDDAVTSLMPNSQVLCAAIPRCNLRIQFGLPRPEPTPVIRRIRARLKTFLKVPLSGMNQVLPAGAHSEAPPLQPPKISLP